MIKAIKIRLFPTKEQELLINYKRGREHSLSIMN